MLGSRVFKQLTKSKWKSFNNKSELGLNLLYLEIRTQRGAEQRDDTCKLRVLRRDYTY